MKPLQAGLAAILLLAPALGAAELRIPGRGPLRIPLPAAWREVPSEGAPVPTLAFQRTGDLGGSLQVSLVQGRDAAFTAPASIRALALNGQAPLKGGTVETELPLAPLAGVLGRGFWYAATDRAWKAGDEGWPVLTHGDLGRDGVLVSFTVLSAAKEDAAVKEAMAAVLAASFPPTRVEGAGLALAMDLSGFQQKLGHEHYRGAYHRLGFYTSESTGLIFSILVDDLGGRTLRDLEKAAASNARGEASLVPGGRIASEPVAAPAGVLVSWPANMGGAAKGHFQTHWYFETIHQGRWLELHFSKVFKDGEDTSEAHQEVLRVVRSLEP
ncbi:MAG TPA: hypothetical protein VK188_06090 [Holophaga sp.]|nr:hypothetical protein [Holophaga sp.]